MKTRPRYRLRLSRDAAANRALFAKGMPGDEWVGDHHAFWVASAGSGEVVGFCSAVIVDPEQSVFLSSAWVTPAHRGRGLQRRMVAHRLRWAKRNGAEYAVTYTIPHNWQSAATLVRCGFRHFEPEWAWAGRSVWYFIRSTSSR